MSDKNLLVATDTTGSAFKWNGGEGVVTVFGTFDGATFSIDMRLDSADTWVGIGSEGELTADGAYNISLPPCQIRGAIASAGGSTSVTATAREA